MTTLQELHNRYMATREVDIEWKNKIQSEDEEFRVIGEKRVIHYIHATMFAGKTAQMINAYEIYKRKGLNPVILKPAIDDREGKQSGWGTTKSRLMEKEVPCYYYNDIKEIYQLNAGAILVDECQFMADKDVKYLAAYTDELNINLLGYGLKTDINGNLFEGAKSWLALADKVTEMECLCQAPNCTEKAILHARFIDGKRNRNGDSVAIEKGNVTYASLCRKHWREM